MNMEIKVKRNTSDAKLPKYAHSTDAGMDLFIPEFYQINIKPDERVLIDLGISMAIPEKHVGMIVDKSSQAIKGLHVLAGIVDSAYRGNICVVLKNLSDNYIVLESGTKVAQMMIVPIPKVELKEVNELDDTDRGSGGFGSTGAR